MQGDLSIVVFWLGCPVKVQEIAEVAHRLYRQPLDAGMAWEGGDGAGVAVWVPPGGAALLAASGRSDAAGPPIDSGDASGREQIWEWLGTFVAEDVWYLETLGVDPSSQRTGVGTALTRHGLGLAAASGAAALLETSVAANVPYYERFGFDVVDEADAPEGGPHVWFMRCEPRAAGSATAANPLAL